MKQKIGDYDTMVKVLKKAGCYREQLTNHDKWTNPHNGISRSFPRKHGRFSRMVARRLLKEIGVN